MPEVSHQHAVSRYLISIYISHLPLCQVRERHDSSCRASFHTALGVTAGVAGRHSTPRAAAPSQEAGRALNLARSPPNEWGQARFVGQCRGGLTVPLGLAIASGATGAGVDANSSNIRMTSPSASMTSTLGALSSPASRALRRLFPRRCTRCDDAKDSPHDCQRNRHRYCITSFTLHL
jgi:hypothetical protein